METIVFAGDSITQGSGYVQLVADALDPPARCINAGISGDTVLQLEQRWATDVVAHDPDVLVVYIGINDVYTGVPVETFDATLRRLLDDAPERLVLVEPFYLGSGREFTTLGDIVATVRAIAADHAAPSVALQDVLTDIALAPDGVHPTPAGAALIAEAVGAALTRGGRKSHAD